MGTIYRIIAAVNSRVRKASHNYLIEVPTSLDHVKKTDEINDNIFWMDAINKDMGKISVSFEILEPGKPIPVRCDKICP